MTNLQPWVVDLDALCANCRNHPAIQALALLNAMKGETHRRWLIIPNVNGAWNYEKVHDVRS